MPVVGEEGGDVSEQREQCDRITSLPAWHLPLTISSQTYANIHIRHFRENSLLHQSPPKSVHLHPENVLSQPQPLPARLTIVVASVVSQRIAQHRTVTRGRTKRNKNTAQKSPALVCRRLGHRRHPHLRPQARRISQ